MRTNKHTLIATLALGLAVSSLSFYSQAQDAKDTKKADKPAASADAKPPTRAGRQGGDRTAALKEALNLTDEQVAKLKPIMQEQAKKSREVRADTTLSDADKRSKVREITQESNTKIEALLTPDQKEKWAKQREAGRGRGQGQGQGRRQQQPPATPAK